MVLIKKKDLWMLIYVEKYSEISGKLKKDEKWSSTKLDHSSWVAFIKIFFLFFYLYVYLFWLLVLLITLIRVDCPFCYYQMWTYLSTCIWLINNFLVTFQISVDNSANSSLLMRCELLVLLRISWISADNLPIYSHFWFSFFYQQWF